MDIVSSYAAEVLHADKIFYTTVNVYRRAVSFCIDAFEKEQNELSSIEKTNERRRACHASDKSS